MRLIGFYSIMLIAVPVGAQVTIDSNGVRSGDVVIDSRGVHTPQASVDRSAVTQRGRRVGNASGGRQILANHQRLTIECTRSGLTVIGNHNDLTVRNCTRLSVPGNYNRISARFTADGSIGVMGNRNTVTWTAPRETRVSVSNIGSKNEVTRSGS